MVHVSATIVGWNHTTYHKARARKFKDCFSHSAITNKTFGLPTLPEETSSLQMASAQRALIEDPEETGFKQDVVLKKVT